MAAIEIDEAELANYRNVTGVMTALLGDSRTRAAVLKAVKVVNPKAVIPEIDAAEPYIGQLAEVAKSVKDLHEAVVKDKTDREEAAKLAALNAEWESGRAALRTSGYTEDAVKQIEDLMGKEGIRSHKIAAAAFERLNPPAPAVSSSSRYPNKVFDPKAQTEDTFLKGLMEGDTESSLDTMIARTLAEVRGTAQ